MNEFSKILIPIIVISMIQVNVGNLIWKVIIDFDSYYKFLE